jgi:hypothetical protein
MDRMLTAIAVAASALALSACEVEQTEEGEMPEVDVETEGGNLPEYDVEGPDVDVGTEERTITVPDVDVDPPDDDEEVPEDPPDGR